MPVDWEERKSNKADCRHCKKFMKIDKSEHTEKFDPNLKSWVSICKRCGMVEKIGG